MSVMRASAFGIRSSRAPMRRLREKLRSSTALGEFHAIVKTNPIGQ